MQFFNIITINNNTINNWDKNPLFETVSSNFFRNFLRHIFSPQSANFRSGNLECVSIFLFFFHDCIFTQCNVSSLNYALSNRFELANCNRMSSNAPLPADYVSEATTYISIRWCITCTCTYTYIRPGSEPVKPVRGTVPGSRFPVPVPLYPLSAKLSRQSSSKRHVTPVNPPSDFTIQKDESCELLFRNFDARLTKPITL